MRNVGEDGEEKYDKNKDVEEKKARKRSRREEIEKKTIRNGSKNI